MTDRVNTGNRDEFAENDPPTPRSNAADERLVRETIAARRTWAEEVNQTIRVIAFLALLAFVAWLIWGRS